MMITWSYFEEHDKPSKKINQRPWPRQDQIFTTTRRTKDTTIIDNLKKHVIVVLRIHVPYVLYYYPFGHLHFFVNVFVLLILFSGYILYTYFLYRHHHHYHYHHHFFVISNMRLKTGNQNANHHLLSLIYGQRDCTNVPSKKDKQFWMLKNIFTHVRLFTHQTKQYLLYLSCFLLQAVSFVGHVMMIFMEKQ